MKPTIFQSSHKESNTKSFSLDYNNIGAPIHQSTPSLVRRGVNQARNGFSIMEENCSLHEEAALPSVLSPIRATCSNNITAIEEEPEITKIEKL